MTMTMTTTTTTNKLGKYRLVAELARGGMGIVWLAEMLGPGGFSKTCVVKELLPELASDPHHRAMFLDEASLAARLSHKNIVQTNEVGSEENRLFMALELLEGCTLRRAQDVLGGAGVGVPPALAVRIVCEVLSALDHAHELRDRESGESLGIVHRDVTPQNVFLTFDGQVKLLDFGVAKSRARREQTREGFAKGCISYMSPDHVANAPIDRRADIFAAGILLRELLTGRRVWEDTDEDEVIVRRLIVGDIPKFPTSPSTSVPVPVPVPMVVLRRICETAMAERPSDRFATAAHMREALEWWLACEDSTGSLGDLVKLFDDEGVLATERVRVRDQLRARKKLPAKPPVPVASALKTLPSSDLQTVVDVEVPTTTTTTTSVTAKLRRLPKRELFVAAMALVASIAAALSIAGSDDGPMPTAHEVVIVSAGVVTQTEAAASPKSATSP
jgi:serine/threonine protein kinase